MADRKISDLTALTTPASGDYLPIVDISEAAAASKNKRITIEELMRGVPDGTAAAPGIAFETDPNTGIFSPGADQLAISTGGTGRLFVDASGNVGIATASPGTKLHVNGPVKIGEGVATNTSKLLVNTLAGTAAGIQLFQDATESWIIQNPASSADLTFGASGTERLRITSAGLVGIGTSSVASTLHIVDSSSAANGTIRLGGGPAFSGYNSTIQQDGQTTGKLLFNSAATAGTGHGHQFQVDGTAAVTIDASRRVGIGTTSAANQLQLSTDSAGKPSTNTWTIVSDERIKEKIELADLDLCYEAVKNIPLKRFKWKDEVYTEEQVKDRRKLGWIAQDVEAVFPKAVSTHEFKYNQVFEETIIPAVEEVLDDEGNVTTPAQPERIEKGELISEDVIEDCRDLNSDQLYAAMYGAIQKLMIKVETLETELAALKAP